jgi:spore photoproduct lyase
MKVEKVERKSMIIRESGRSTDFISPSFGHGCLYNCTYCYMKRHKPDALSIANNPETILGKMNDHLLTLDTKVSNQTHPEFWTYDISCNEDFALHLKYHDWKLIFDWFKYNEQGVLGSFATKCVKEELLSYNSFDLEGQPRIRIRMSLMPEVYRQDLEPNTATIKDRILFIDRLIEAGYDVDINFSPVIVHPGAFELYRGLFEEVALNVKKENWDRVDCEVIFLTHNEDKHLYNLENNLTGEELLWRPDMQEAKTSQYGGKNIRYNWKLKKQLIKEWTKLHNSIIPWNTIRYIF